MKLIIHFRIPNTLTLSMSHHHVIQGFIYHLLKNDIRFSTFLHNEGFSYGNRDFKLFTFGPLIGKYQISNGTITFSDQITLEIRSPLEDFMTIILNALQNTTQFNIDGQQVFVEKVDVCKKPFFKQKEIIQMVSPITVYQTTEIDGRKQTIYYNPLDEEFQSLISHNFFRKYYSYYGTYPDSAPKISVLQVGTKDKYITKFKNITYINGWKGIYQIEGNPEYLEFLYYSGLGAKNSQGFGMFELKS